MKIKNFGLVALVASMVALDANAGARSSMYSSINMRNSDGDTIKIKRGVSESRAYDDGYRYQARRSNRSSLYGSSAERDYQRAEPEMTTKTTYKTGETYKKTARRKYFIANPFYQPLQGQFGSVTTGEYLEGKYNFAMSVGDAKRKLSEWSIKEDLSYGLTDRIALQAMAKYNSDKLKWQDNTGDSDVYKNHDLNLFGFGVQGRIVDTNDWISTVSGYYEHQKHGVDYYIADIKAGYKVATSTIYGLARAWVVDMEGDYYGDYIEDPDNNIWQMMKYGKSSDPLFMGELAAGVWTVLAEDWTLNVEGMFGYYDWHNQLSVKGAFGWQPNDWFALNLYAKTSIYDSANKKDLDIYVGNLPLNQVTWYDAVVVPAELSKFHEWSAGLQVMFQF